MFIKKVEKTKRMGQAKRDTLWIEIETEGKWQKKMKQTDFTGGKNKEIHKRKKKEKSHEKEKTQQKEIKEE